MEIPKPDSIHVIVNPAPSRRIPLLAILNQCFRDAGIHWDISITHGDGDGRVMTEKAIAAGAKAIGVYGGDGTVMEVAGALVGTDIPLLILPGGTGNLVAAELRLPVQLEKACERICGETYQVRNIDVGMMGDHPFLLRVGCGFEPGVVQEATRELKNQFGKWAYVFGGIKSLQDTKPVEYEITIDDKETISETGVSCVVANAGTVGFGRVMLAPSVDIDDGLLDVFFIKKNNIESIAQLGMKMMGIDKQLKDVIPDLDISPLVTHWTATKVEIKTDPPIDIQVDGDVIAKTPQSFHLKPGALRVVV